MPFFIQCCQLSDLGLIPLDNSAPKLNSNSQDTGVKKKPTRCVQVLMDGYVLSCIKERLETSTVYRRMLTEHYTKVKGDTHWKLIVKLVPPEQHVLDYKWAKMIDTMVVERRELDNSFSWMSTLGGAYSALGDYVTNFAVIAGRISVRQLELALRLGDTPVVIRCCLYYALSLIQQSQLRSARQVIRTQYRLATQLPVDDTKLINICKGIWSRLQYEWSLRRKRRKEGRGAL